MNLKAGIPIQFGAVSAMIYGGPFKQYIHGTRRLVGVKMAKEIDHPHDISIPTEDFCTPDTQEMQWGALSAIDAILLGKDIYAGCMGGIGRTGLFMGCMAKVMVDYISSYGGVYPCPKDPVMYVRHHFKPHAIETDEQQEFVRGFDTSKAVALLHSRLGPRVNTIIRTRTVTEYLSPWAWVLHQFGK